MAADMNPSAPPVEAWDELPPEPASWPKVVGVISIVYSALFLTCSGCGITIMAVMPRMMAGQPGIDEGFPPSMQMYPLKLVWFGVGMTLLLLLLAAGISCVMRRPIARPLHLTWAVLSLVLGIAMLFLIQIPELHATEQWMKDHPGSPFAKGQSSGAAGPIRYASTVFFTALGFAWPVFCLVWFGVVKRNSRDLDSGGEKPAA